MKTKKEKRGSRGFSYLAFSWPFAQPTGVRTPLVRAGEPERSHSSSPKFHIPGSISTQHRLTVTPTGDVSEFNKALVVRIYVLEKIAFHGLG